MEDISNNNQFDSLNKKTMESIDSFIKLTEMAVSYYDEHANLKWESHNNKKMCALCNAYGDEESLCKMNLKYAGNIASQLGEPYIFLCKARLTMIAFPVIIKDDHIGTFIAGPVILGKIRNNVIEYVLNRSNNTKKQAGIFSRLNETKVFEPKMVSAVATIFGDCILASINSNPQYENISNSFKKTQAVSETIQNNKKGFSDDKDSDPLEIERELIEAVTSGNTDESIELLNKYLDAVTLVNIGDIGLIKVDIIQMFGLLLRKIKDDVAVFEDAKDKFNFQMDRINKVKNIAELSSVVTDLVEQITNLFETGIYMGDVDIVRKTISYVSKNYKERISLKMISDDLHISTPYLSTLFKKEMGKTFSDFLTHFRIKKSKSMLTETSMSITEIAMLSGFEDQSYFNKVFKKVTGMTPKKYREVG